MQDPSAQQVTLTHGHITLGGTVTNRAQQDFGRAELASGLLLLSILFPPL